jgi:glucosamine-6-phosphate deaminase
LRTVGDEHVVVDRELIDEAARLTPSDLMHLSRPGFNVILYDTLEDFYLAEALEYINAWRASSDDSPIGICGPIGPTEQLPLVARIVNALDLDVRSGHFWGMDEWFDTATGREVDAARHVRSAGHRRAAGRRQNSDCGRSRRYESSHRRTP